MYGRKNLQPSFSTIFLIGAEFSKVYFSSLFLSNILIFVLKCAQKSVVLGQDFFPSGRILCQTGCEVSLRVGNTVEGIY
jgi:hypothetical protein